MQSIQKYDGNISPVITTDTSAIGTNLSSAITDNSGSWLLSYVRIDDQVQSLPVQNVMLPIWKTKFYLFLECFLFIIPASYIAFEIMLNVIKLSSFTQPADEILNPMNVIHSVFTSLLIIMTIIVLILLIKPLTTVKEALDNRLITTPLFVFLCMVWIITIVNYITNVISIFKASSCQNVTGITVICDGLLVFVDIFLVYQLIKYKINFNSNHLSNSVYFLLKYTIYLTFCSILINGVSKIFEGFQFSYNFNSPLKYSYTHIYDYTYPFPFIYSFTTVFIFFQVIKQINNRFIYEREIIDGVQMNRDVNLFKSINYVTIIGIFSLILMFLSFIGMSLFVYKRYYKLVYPSIITGFISTIICIILFNYMSTVEAIRNQQKYKSYQIINAIFFTGQILFCLNYIIIFIQLGGGAIIIVYFSVLCLEAILQSTIMHYMFAINYKIRINKSVAIKLFTLILLLVGANLGFAISHFIVKRIPFDDLNNGLNPYTHYFIEVLSTPCGSVYRLFCVISFMYFLFKLRSK